MADSIGTPIQGDDRWSAVERITVALTPQTGEALQRLTERASLSKTDATRRAITLYEFIDAQLRAGREVLIRDRKTGETQSLLIL
jgi:hypothetical protein